MGRFKELDFAHSHVTCGPKLSDTIENTIQHINNGKIVAIKGLAGFHIVCDATNDETI
jgi:hydrogenase maturation protein HypF